MKKIFTMLSLLASVALVGCSDDNDLLNKDGDGGNENNKECGYVAVNIVQPGSATGRGISRADAVPGDFVAGDDKENFANEATFIIFNTDGSYVSTQTKKLTASTGNITDNSVEKIYNSVLVLDNKGEDGSIEGEIFCILNPTDKIKTWAPADEKTLREEIGDYCTGFTESGKFIMTNSAYKESSTGGATGSTTTTEICGAKFTKANYKASAEEAKTNPVDIYVERVVAKVKTTQAAEANFGTATATVNGKTLTIRVTGIGYANVAQQAYLFKNITKAENAYWPNWGDNLIFDATHHRSYWEAMPTADAMGTLKNHRYTEYYKVNSFEKAEANGDTIYTALASLTSSNSTYILPNTYGGNDKTAVLVTAQLLEEVTTPTAGGGTTPVSPAPAAGGSSSKTYKPADLVWFRGCYFDNAGAMNLLCEHLAMAGFRKKTSSTPSATYESIVPADLEWRQTYDKSASETKQTVPNLAQYQAVAQLKESVTNVVQLERQSDGSLAEKTGADKYTVNGFLTGQEYFAEVFTQGRCYYYVYIDHTNVLGSNATDKTKFDGVVRNHIYDLNLTGISGIGTAVFDPSTVIIPQKPNHEQFSYLAARINVLKWKLVKQDVSFSGDN